MSDQRELARALEAMSREREVDPRRAAPAPSTRPATPDDLRPGPPVASKGQPQQAAAPASDLAGTLFPVSFILALTLPWLGIGWYLLDPSRVIRTIPSYVPIGLICAGLACGAGAFILRRGLTRSARST